MLSYIRSSIENNEMCIFSIFYFLYPSLKVIILIAGLTNGTVGPLLPLFKTIETKHHGTHWPVSLQTLTSRNLGIITITCDDSPIHSLPTTLTLETSVTDPFVGESLILSSVLDTTHMVALTTLGTFQKLILPLLVVPPVLMAGGALVAATAGPIPEKGLEFERFCLLQVDLELCERHGCEGRREKGAQGITSLAIRV